MVRTGNKRLVKELNDIIQLCENRIWSDDRKELLEKIKVLKAYTKKYVKKGKEKLE